MRDLIILSIIFLIVSCDPISSSNSTLETQKAIRSALTKVILVDTASLPIQGNGVKHIQPIYSFAEQPDLFEIFLQALDSLDLPLSIEENMLDKTDESWAKETALPTKFYPYLLDKEAYEYAASVVNPKEQLNDFYKVYPVGLLGEFPFYYSTLIATRYLDGNGQQDFYYMLTFAKNGTLLSSIEVGAFEASTVTYMKTAKLFEQGNLVEVSKMEYNFETRVWDMLTKSQYFLNNVGNIYAQFEDLSVTIDEIQQIENQRVENKYGAAFRSPNEFENYFSKFQQVIRKNNKDEISQLLTFPHLRISIEEIFLDIKSKEEFLQKYEMIFSPALRKKIVKQNLDDLIIQPDGVGLSDGSLWFKRVGMDNSGRLIIGVFVN